MDRWIDIDIDVFRVNMKVYSNCIRHGGLASLYFGLPMRCARVFAEVGLQFALYDRVSAALDGSLFAHNGR